MFERRHEPLLPKTLFVLRMARSVGLGLGMVAACLCLGIIGYHLTEGQPWLDALLNASMILSGMGPVSPVVTDAGKLFASFYALFSGVAFITMVGLMFGPVVHRIIHRFHLELESESDADSGSDGKGSSGNGPK